NKKEMFFLWAEEDGVKSGVLKFRHSDSNSFDFGEESDGTQRLWELLEVLLTDEEKIFFIDEIDRCMHPSLTYKFVKNFFELTENKNVQLVVTTHESRLLDFDLLRRDEIWFVEKQKNGDSEIYSLEDYNERFDRKIDKAYLEGRYGGVPVFTSLFPVDEDE
ncbi:MAG: AAA family ATPase, partial [Clostridia bacterium]|nr:AAA family ATPase [Clostridia bacterium]